MKQHIHLDPVLAYSRIAPEFARLSDRRRAYLAAIERLVIREIPPASRSLLDVGAGDGTRAFRVAHATLIEKLVLLEPSAAMRQNWPPETQCWPIRAEELSEKNDSFDVITCLWNVLGHISTSASRTDVLRHCGRLLSPDGRVFIDVNHRYNVLQYGAFRTAFRMLRDRLLPGEKNGDVIARWNVNGAKYATNGHVFSNREFRRSARLAGLTIEKKFTVNYSTGQIHRWSFAGNPLYVLRRTSSSADPKTRQTSRT